ncbi:MAG: hypothetical protein EOO41_04445, partial [Methanobacteriota archaeon]
MGSAVLAAGSTPSVQNSIVWRRRTPVHTASGISFSAADEGIVQPFVALFWSGEAFVSALSAGGTNLLAQFAAHVRLLFSEQPVRVLFIVQGAHAYILHRLRTGAESEDELPSITRDGLEAAITHMFTFSDIETKETVRRLPRTRAHPFLRAACAPRIHLPECAVRACAFSFCARICAHVQESMEETAEYLA